MLKLPRLIFIFLGLFTSGLVLADTNLEKPPENIAEEPVPPAEVIDKEKEHLPDPDVRIIKRKDAVIEEYRVNGRLRYAKIIPSKGPAYYMVDTDGDGDLDTRHNNLSNPPIQQWILYQW